MGRGDWLEGKTGGLNVEVVVWERRSKGLKVSGELKFRKAREIENRGLFGRLERGGRKVVEERGRN